jgi:hypothetical protein
VPTMPAVSAAPATAPPAARCMADFSGTERCLPTVAAVIYVSVPFDRPWIAIQGLQVLPAPRGGARLIWNPSVTHPTRQGEAHAIAFGDVLQRKRQLRRI